MAAYNITDPSMLLCSCSDYRVYLGGAVESLMKLTQD